MEKWGWLPKSRIMVAIFNWITQEKASKGSHTSKKPQKNPIKCQSIFTLRIFAKCCLYSSELFFHVVNVWTQKNGLRWLWGKKLNSSAYFESMWHFSLFILQIQNTMMKTISSFQLLEVNFSYNVCIFVMSAGLHTNKGFKWETAQVHDRICMDTKNLLCY